MKIYLATPYNHSDYNIRVNRFNNINKIAASIMNDGHIVYSPISHSHPIAEYGNLPKDWSFWEKYDRTFLEWADELWVFGGKSTEGMADEIKAAEPLGIPVQYFDEKCERRLA